MSQRRCYAVAFALLMLSGYALCQDNGKNAPTLGEVRKELQNTKVFIMGPVTNLGGGPRVLLEWNIVHSEGKRYVADEMEHLPASYQGTVARVIAVQLDDAAESSNSVNALGQAVSKEDTADPYFDVVVQFPDGHVAMLATYFGTMDDNLEPFSEHQGIAKRLKSSLPELVGKSVYATGLTGLYADNATLDDIDGVCNLSSDCKLQALQRKIIDYPFLEPLTILAAKYVDSVSGVVIEVQLPGGAKALSFTPWLFIRDNETSDQSTPILDRACGDLLLSIPARLRPLEVTAIRKKSLVRGMSKEALEYVLGLPSKENDWGRGGKQLIFGSVTVYLDRKERVVDWQVLDE